MADDPNIRNGSDRDRINVNQDHELRNWAQTLGVSVDQVKKAVQAVGDRADRVREHLRGGAGGRTSDRAK
jgi:hypothetical protein